MMRNARLLGIVVGVAAVGLFMAALGWLNGARADGVLSGGGYALGLFGALLATLPLGGMAVLLFARGSADTDAQARAAQLRKLLNLVLTKGKVSIGEAVTELEAPRETVRALLLEAVGRGLFSGYVNWSEGVLYSREGAAGVQPCPNCGGTIDIAGRGVLQCPYCGTEIFQALGDGQATVRGVAPPAGGGPDALRPDKVADGAIAFDGGGPNDGAEAGTGAGGGPDGSPDGSSDGSSDDGPGGGARP
ncbi:MAG: hypothetical protein IPG72_10530 [Ardenticatenales bacterium]|jgi:hypothetical protein|nr:hypothetical protein [Ardenticatenales bacterium]